MAFVAGVYIFTLLLVTALGLAIGNSFDAEWLTMLFVTCVYYVLGCLATFLSVARAISRP